MFRSAVLSMLALTATGCGPPLPANDSASPTSVCHWYADTDGDGYGDPDDRFTTDCEPQPAARVQNSDDCDDTDEDIHPLAAEACNGADDDCDGQVDEDLSQTWYSDTDGDGFGADDSAFQACDPGSTAVAEAGDCDDNDAATYPGAAETCDGRDNDCDGEADSGVLGSSAACAAASCRDLLLARPELASGVYPIQVDVDRVADLLCDMERDGGGWTLAFLKNSADYDAYANVGSGWEDVADLQEDPAAASLSDTARGGWTDLNLLPYDTLVLAAYYAGAETYRSNPIDRTELRIAFGQDGYFLYGGTSGYYWCAGAHAYTDNGIGQQNQPAGAPGDCKGHGSLGSGWDFSASASANQGLTLCGVDSSSRWMYAAWASTPVTYPAAGGATAIWVR